jgi:hypothetical protein
MNSNRLLIILLFFGCLFSAPFANDEKQSHLNSSQLPLVLKLNGGGSNESSELGPKMASKQVPQQIKNSQNQPNKGSGSSSSVSKTDQSSLQPGNNLKYYPNGNPSGSGSGNTGPEATEWETKASCPNPDEIISNINFWNSYLNSKDYCPNIDIEFEDQEEWDYENTKLIEIPDEVLSKLQRRRRLLSTTPTGKLDKIVKKQHTYSTHDLQPFTFYSKEGKLLTIKNCIRAFR